MRLEVLVDKQEPLVYPMDKEQILIGSSDVCDIVLNIEGISRKHAIIFCSTDEFFIIDQGSTNGSFINEERLVPGRRFEFTSFFPIRLGESVLLTLLSEDEAGNAKISKFNKQDSASDSEKDSHTRITKMPVRSSRDREATLKLETHRKKVSSKYTSKKQSTKPKKKVVKKEDKKFNIMILGAIGIFLGTLYYQMNQEVEVPVARVADGSSAPAQVQATSPIALVEDRYIRSGDDLKEIQMDFKCVSDIEKEACQMFGLSQPFGVTQRGLDLHVFLDGNIAQDFFKEFAQVNPEVQLNKSQILTVFYLLSHDFTYSEKMSDYRIHLHFTDEEQNIIGNGSYYPKTATVFRSTTSLGIVRDVIRSGDKILDFSKEYLRFYP